MTPCPKPVKRAKRPRKALARSWMRKRARSRRQEALTADDKAYLAWVALKPCVWFGRFDHVCHETIQVAHFRDMTGAARKEGARWTLPLCLTLHRMYDQSRGPFAEMDRDSRKEWFRNWVRTMWAAYDGTVV